MEVDASETTSFGHKSEGTLLPLLKEVKEQADGCDVTIKVGDWIKKFHWRVLSVSPFFKACRSNDFVEKRMNVIEIKDASRASVEDAIHFMYGEKPTMTMENIQDLLHIAEFLLLPNLKVACTRWLKWVHLTNTIFFKVLMLASRFDLKVTMSTLSNYLRQNVIQLLQEEEAVSLEKESIEQLLRDPSLAYVSEKHWFKYLVRWSNACSTREPYFSDLFSLLNLHDTDDDLQTEILQEPLVRKLGTRTLSHLSGIFKPSIDDTRKVLIFQRRNICRNVPCFRLKKRRWCTIKETNEEMMFSDIISVKDTDSPVVYRRDMSSPNVIITQDMSSKMWKESQLLYEDDLLALDVDIYVANSVCYSVRCKSKTDKTRTLYRGTLQGEKTIMQPIVTLKIAPVDHLTVDKAGTVAVLSKISKCLILFDETEGKLQKVRLSKDFDTNGPSQLIACEKGFMIYNGRRLCYVSRTEGNGGNTVMYAHLPPVTGISRVVVCNNTCIRYSRPIDSPTMAFIFHSSSIDNLFSYGLGLHNWQLLTHPQNCDRGFGSIVGTAAFVISLPKSMLECSLQCLHCGIKKSDYDSS